MNFLYNRGGRSGGSDGHSPLSLGRGRVKLQPRRLRSAAAAAAAASAAEQEASERVTRTHLFLGFGGGGGGGGDGESRPRRSGLVGWLTGRGKRRTSRSRQEEEQAQEPPTVTVVPPPPPDPCEQELLSLDQLSQDCFMVPHALVHRFLPTGHKLPTSPPARGQRLRMHETSDPDLSVVLHVLTPLEPVTPPSVLEPVSPLQVQLTACLSLLKRVAAAGKTRDAILLSNLERTEPFPFLLYYTVAKSGRAAQEVLSEVRHGVRTTFSPLQTTLVGQHTVRLYQEVATIARPPLTDQRRPSSDRTGYIISVFRVMEGDDRHSFERDWPSWTGARLLYRTIPKRAGLRRIVLHKSYDSDTGDIFYILSCEYSRLLDDVVSTVKTLPALRARLIGYTGIYKPMAVL
ncbi:uncharacterized protein LOC122394024 [Amphibalanus amphitrite]|uniref:uncharacterized protein LOC122394024 n=1 Tax=Amphibalanus amphitrite TaxID=1232801 RepID=UPI001C8FA938|nr:uncharacterized protein LOC122394024 [Amphibalanus amphitrite]